MQNTIDARYNYMQEKIREILVDARDVWPSGIICYYPAGSRDYQALYIRDFTYMVEAVPEFIPVEDVKSILDLFMENIHYNLYCVPETIGKDGKPYYCCHGSRIPTSDSPMFLVKLLYAYHEYYGRDKNYIREKFQLICNAMDAVICDMNTGLVWIDPHAPHTGYGFMDTVAASGHNLFCSILYHEACRIMRYFAGIIGDSARMEIFEMRARKIENSITILYDREIKMFFAASVDCRQPDVWGSIYGCVEGVFSDEITDLVSKSLYERKDEFLYRYQIRHLLKPEYWKKTYSRNIDWYNILKAGHFQNGAYWATPCGWWAELLELRNKGEGIEFLNNLSKEFELNGIWEHVQAGGWARIKDNLSSIVLPFKSFKKILKTYKEETYSTDC